MHVLITSIGSIATEKKCRHRFLDAQRQLLSRSQWWDLVEMFIKWALVTYKNIEGPFQNEGTRVATTFLPILSLGIFPDAQLQLAPQSVVGSGRILNSFETLWLSSLTASIRVVTQLYINFLDAQGQVTP